MIKLLRKVAQARSLRKRLTEPEQLLWQRLKSRDGIAYRRQYPIGPYVLDFYCAKAKLCIEVDGGFHDAERDERRDTWLNLQSIEVYRIPAFEVYRDADAVADGVKCLAHARYQERKKSPPPSPFG